MAMIDMPATATAQMPMRGARIFVLILALVRKDIPGSTDKRRIAVWLVAREEGMPSAAPKPYGFTMRRLDAFKGLAW
ncbi:hypothetical protein [Shinella zoogloeoides]|uniref:hypothetical protein n=1 Tax=Shinella zoogloeoides TaxID=352475 RepID=UPI001F58762E|nr:hypothetical protein [Shinella zoogloeoides]